MINLCKPKPINYSNGSSFKTGYLAQIIVGCGSTDVDNSLNSLLAFSKIVLHYWFRTS